MVDIVLRHQVLRHLIIVGLAAWVCVRDATIQRQKSTVAVSAPAWVHLVFTSGATNRRHVTEIISGVKWLLQNSIQHSENSNKYKVCCVPFPSNELSPSLELQNLWLSYRKSGCGSGSPQRYMEQWAVPAQLCGFDIKSQCKNEEEQVWFSEKFRSREVLIHSPACNAPDDAEILGNDRFSLRFISRSPSI